jgi:uncharacterized protein YgbK (DUF1537 family)
MTRRTRVACMHDPMLEVAVIADDLTGAADTGVQFCPYFANTVLVSYRDLSPDLLGLSPQVLSVYTNSRSIHAELARERTGHVAGQLSVFHPKHIYKKVDSCLRGNLGAEVDVILDEMGFEHSFIAPAFPKMGRTTSHDIHQLDGTPVSQTELSKDPLTPVTESRLSRIVAAQSRYEVGHVDVSVVDSPDEVLMREIDRLVQSGSRHLAFDATDNAHLERIARTAITSGKKILLVGSAGLAEGLAQLFPKRPLKAKNVMTVFPEGHHLLVCGTTSERNKLQILALIEAHPYEVISLSSGLLADKTQRERLLSKARLAHRVLSEKDVIIRIDDPETWDGEKVDNSSAWTAEQIVNGLGLFIASVLKQTRPMSLFLTGGDTANAVFKAIGAKEIRLFGEIVPGMVQGMIMGGLIDGLPVVTKAGAFGNLDALVVLHEYWRKNIRQNRNDL